MNMKELIIVGAGGMGRSVYCIAENSIGYGTVFTIKGFLDDNLNALDGFSGYKPILSTISDYQPEPDDVFVCSIGDVAIKEKLCESLKEKGGKFFSLIHNRAHDSVIGNYARIDTQCSLVGGTIVKDRATIYTHAMISHNVTVGEGAVVGACSFVIRSVKPGTSVFGVPAKPIY